MNQYILTYMGGDHPSDPEEQKKHFMEYQQWLGSLGDSVIKPMAPYRNTQTIHPDGSATEGSNADASGHTIIQAESIEAAVEMAKGCPFLAINGTLEVSEIVEM